MTSTFFIDLTITVFGYLILALSFLGAGWFFSRILKMRFPQNRVFSLIWLGWAFILLILQVLNLLFPINTYSTIPILSFGLISAVLFFKTEFQKPIQPLSRIYFILLVVAVFWIADLSMAATTIYDDGLYHFNAVRWLNESPIVLGLGNLHGRLALNQSSFAYVAYLNFYPLFNHGYNLANSFLLLLLLAECLLYLSKYMSREVPKDPSGTNLVSIFFIFPLLYLALYSQLPSPTADNTASILQILLFIYFVRALHEKSSSSNDVSQILLIFILSAVAITVKLSNLFYVVSICIILLFLKRMSLFEYPEQIPSRLIKLLTIPVFVLIVWILRGILLSGCPAYPSTAGCINVSWAVPIAAVKDEANWIYSWARLPNYGPEDVLNSWGWLRPWFHNVLVGNPFTVDYPVLIFIISIITSLILYLRQPLSRRGNRVWLVFIAPVFMGLVFWFFTAPDVRFANALFWILPVASTLFLFKLLEKQGRLKNVIIVLMFLLLNANVVLEVVLYPYMRTSVIGYMPFASANLVEKQTLSGLRVLVPAKGDQCWDSELPCTPNFNDRLSFIDREYFPEFTVTSTEK